jgi:hypothetical protein
VDFKVAELTTTEAELTKKEAESSKEVAQLIEKIEVLMREVAAKDVVVQGLEEEVRALTAQLLVCVSACVCV